MIEQKELKITVPVLLVGFNRPDTIQKVFDGIRNARPEKLYVAIDGPRDNREGEQELVKQVRNIVKQVDWPCQTHYRFSELNNGAEITVSSAISWVLEKEEYVIILEDDIVAPLSFFNFMQKMLLRFNNDERIGTVTGSNFTPIQLKNNDDYFFAKYGHSGGGWGTWKRVWKDYNLNVEIPDEHLEPSFLQKITNSKTERNYYRKRFKAIQQRGPGNSTWDNIGFYNLRINNLLSVIPRVNLTSNIGIFGLHAKGETKYHFRPFDESFRVKNHPEKIECNIEYDMYHFKTHINKKSPLYKRVIKKLINILR